ADDRQMQLVVEKENEPKVAERSGDHEAERFEQKDGLPAAAIAGHQALEVAGQGLQRILAGSLRRMFKDHLAHESSCTVRGGSKNGGCRVPLLGGGGERAARPPSVVS